MLEASKDTATSTAHVNSILKTMEYDIIGGSRERHRFKDGFRVLKPAEAQGAIPVTITSRRRTYDVQAEVNKIVVEFAKRNLEVHDIVVSPDNKFGSFSVTKEFNRGKTADGKGITRLDGRYWFIQLRASVVWAVQTHDDDTDLRTVEVEGVRYGDYPFDIIAEMRRNVKVPGQRMVNWSLNLRGKKTGEYTGLTAAKDAVIKDLLGKEA
jgi:hypothetical protein